MFTAKWLAFAISWSASLHVNAIDVAVGLHDPQEENIRTMEVNDYAFATTSTAESAGQLLPRRYVDVTPNGKQHQQLLRREVHGGPGSLGALVENGKRSDVDDARRDDAWPLTVNDWHMLSVGDVQAITLDDGNIYAVGHDPLAVIEKGIFRQRLKSLTPYSNWTLIAYGSMSSIAIHTTSSGKVMYGVGSNKLYQQPLATLSIDNVWTEASSFKLSTIAIEGDIIYGLSPSHPGQLFQASLNVMAISTYQSDGGWTLAGSGEVQSFTIVSSTVFAVFRNNGIYHKPLGVAGDQWTLKDPDGMLSIAVLGDSIYGVSLNHRVYRKPLIINKNWNRAAKGPMKSLAISSTEDIIYGLGDDGIVYKQDLVRMAIDTDWTAVSMGTMTSITIQGDMIYAVNAYDKRVYKQRADAMSSSTLWAQASACCVLQIAAADGIVYGIGEDHRVYRQADLLMTPDTEWNLASSGNVVSIAIRGDTIYGIDHEASTLQQRLSDMTSTSAWETSLFGPSWLTASKKHHAIMAHNDVMYACGEDMFVYTKLISRPMVYPRDLVAHGDTRWQAIHSNLTDLAAHLEHPVIMPTLAPTPAPPTMKQASPDTIGRGSAGSSNGTASTPLAAAADHKQDTPPKMSQAGASNHYVNRFQDQKGGENGDVSVGFDTVENGAQGISHVGGAFVLISAFAAVW